jgi:hypothetical protein
VVAQLPHGDVPRRRQLEENRVGCARLEVVKAEDASVRGRQQGALHAGQPGQAREVLSGGRKGAGDAVHYQGVLLSLLVELNADYLGGCLLLVP